MSDSSGVEELYKNYGILADAGADLGKVRDSWTVGRFGGYCSAARNQVPICETGVV